MKVQLITQPDGVRTLYYPQHAGPPLPGSRSVRQRGVNTIDATPLGAFGVWALAEAMHWELPQEVRALAACYPQQIDHPGDSWWPRIDKTGIRFVRPPWAKQLEGMAWLVHKYAALLEWEMSCGKTMVAINACVLWNARRVITVCPQTVLGVWQREIPLSSIDPWDVHILSSDHSVKKRMRLLSDWFLNQSDRKWLVTNYELLRTSPVLRELIAHKWDVAILDESHRAKSPTGVTSKAAYELGRRSTRRLCLSGTAAPNSPLDYFGQYRFLEPGVFGQYVTPFKARYCKLNPVIRNKIDGWINQEELAQKLSEYRHALTLAEMPEIQLQPMREIIIPLYFSSAMLSKYKQLEKEFIADFGPVDDVLENKIVAGNALTRLLRLQQLTGGWAVTDDRREVQVHRIKEQTLRDILEDLPPTEPIVVFAQFTNDLLTIRRVALEMKRTHGEISSRAHDITPDGRMPPNISVLGVQWQAGSLGIDLTRAHYAFIYSSTFNAGDFDQGLRRLHRHGQQHSVTVYRPMIQHTVDYAIMRNVQKKSKVIKELFSTLDLTDVKSSVG